MKPVISQDPVAPPKVENAPLTGRKRSREQSLDERSEHSTPPQTAKRLDRKKSDALLFRAKTLSVVHASVQPVVDPLIKRAEFFNDLSKKAEHPLDYQIAQAANLLSQQAYNLRSHSSKTGIGYGRAIRFYEQVIDTKNAKAAYSLGALYRDGDAYLPQDNEQCMAWYTVAAILGHAQAQFELAQFYEASGRENNLHEDMLRGLAWYQAAFEQSYNGAEEAFSELFQETGEALLSAIEQVQRQVPERVVARLTSTRRFSSGSQGSSKPLSP